MTERHCLGLRGEFDLANYEELERRLDEAIAATDGEFVIDCRDLTFIDSSGVEALAHARVALEAVGRDIRIVHATGAPLRVLELLGLTALLHVNEEAPVHNDA
ncbi:MAG TPA: STAS domain-containing protein [Acidimicrobiia bacterium]|nr:STAS domain-containing protein [Acidimicrobiia bacterium]